MKKLFLTLLLISPLAKSEMLELTCESAFPFQITYNFETKEGVINYLEDYSLLEKSVSSISGGLKRVFPFGKEKIKKFSKEGIYYVIKQGKKLESKTLYINRKNLKFAYDVSMGGRQVITGQCLKEMNELNKYQI